MQRAEQIAFQAIPNGLKSRRVCQLERECKVVRAVRFSTEAYWVQAPARSPNYAPVTECIRTGLRNQRRKDCEFKSHQGYHLLYLEHENMF